MRALTLLGAAAALVISVWFALGARQAIDTSRATAIASESNRATAAQEREVASLERGARLLNPDKEPEVLLGEVEVEHGDTAAARTVLRPVTRSEPENFEAWLWLAHASGGAEFGNALAHVKLLDPFGPPG